MICIFKSFLFKARNYSYLNLTGCNILLQNVSNSLQFLGDSLNPECNEINESFINSYYKLSAEEICFDDVSYSAYGSKEKLDKRTFTMEGEVKYIFSLHVLTYVLEK